MPAEPAQLIGDLMRAFPRQAVSADTVRVYVRELSDVPPDLLDRAVRGLIRTSEWFPTIAAVREAAAELALALPGEADALSQVEARMAWARQDEADRGDRTDVHPLVREALDHVGGFHAFRASDDPGVVRGQFLRLYRDLRSRSLRDARLGALALPAAPGRPALDPPADPEPPAAVS